MVRISIIRTRFDVRRLVEKSSSTLRCIHNKYVPGGCKVCGCSLSFWHGVYANAIVMFVVMDRKAKAGLALAL